MTRRLFHLLDPAALGALAAGEDLAPASLEHEGFVHLSFREQLAGTLAAHYAGVRALVLLEIDPSVGALRVEPSRGGEDFPHVYGPVPAGLVLGAWELQLAAGELRLPDLDPADASRDRPARRPLGERADAQSDDPGGPGPGQGPA